MTTDSLLLTTHLAATCFMAGVIWLCQLVHYPLMARVSEDRFIEYESAHMRRIGPIVGPAMLVEGVTAGWLTVRWFDDLPGLFTVSLLLLVAVWVSTFTMQGPMHQRLARDGYDEPRIRWLVNTNWVRTVAWSARAVLITILLSQASAA